MRYMILWNLNVFLAITFLGAFSKTYEHLLSKILIVFQKLIKPITLIYFFSTIINFYQDYNF